MPVAAKFFWWIMMVWTILAVGHQRNIAARLYWNLSCSFWQEKFSIYIYRKNKPRPLERFLTNYHRLNNLGRGLPKKHFWYISYWNRSSGFWQEEFYGFLYSYIGKTSPTPGGREFVFLKNHDGLNNLNRMSQKKYCCHIILKSLQ